MTQSNSFRATSGKSGRNVSAAGRARIAAAACARLAKVKAQGGSTLSVSENEVGSSSY